MQNTETTHKMIYTCRTPRTNGVPSRGLKPKEIWGKQTVLMLLSLMTCCFFACKKDSYNTSQDAVLFITADTLRFDTVFTTTGSVTQVFKIRNDNNQKIRLDNITLQGSGPSAFHINADGYAGPEINNVDIEAKDSLYVFVSVSADGNASPLPFIIRDSIRISFNGNNRQVQLEAYGQNARFLRNEKISGHITWNNDLPYVILGELKIEQNASLTLEKGCRLYFHADAPLLVEGTLIAEGTGSDRIYFTGDRLDQPYASYPGSWPGIYFRETSKDNSLRFAVIRNAYQGIIAEAPAPNANPKLSLTGCIIDNIYDAGILAVNSSISAVNCLVSNAGGEKGHNVSLTYGGVYDFTHCTIVSYGNNLVTHKNPVLYVNNYIMDGNITYTADLQGRFTNCIFWGGNGVPDNEIIVAKEGATLFNVGFSHCLWKNSNDPEHITSTDIIRNEDPAFDSIDTGNRFYSFRLQPGSPAIDKGISTAVGNDLDDEQRLSGILPDLGAYERPF